jgi:ABC-type multidrug transport system fused ATPase/permease subunit
MAWRVIPHFYQYVVIRIYDYIYENSYCNYENLNITEIIIKLSKMPWILQGTLKSFKEEFCHVFFGSIIGIFYFYFKLGPKYLSVFLTFFTLMVVLQIMNIRHITKLNKQKEKDGDHSFDKLGESLKNIGVVQMFQNVEHEKSILYTILDDYNLTYYKSLHYSIFYDFITKTLNLTMGIVLGYMLWWDYTNKNINKQYLFQCSQVILLLITMCDYIGIVSRSLSDNLGQIYDMNLFFNKEIPYDNQCNRGSDLFKNGDIVFKHIYHKYDTTYAIENVSLSIRKGEKIAFVGESGSGKTTLIKLLMKHQFLVMGSIHIGGININELPTKEIAKHIMYIPQSAKLFNRSLYHNIVYGLKHPPSKTQIIDMLHSMQMDSISAVFIEKMDMDVGRDGSLLSGGQRQVVWLLRSLYRMKPILILDEPTAALDPENKKMVIDTIKKIGVGKTIIIISHDSIDSEFKQIHFKDGALQSYDMFSIR